MIARTKNLALRALTGILFVSIVSAAILAGATSFILLFTAITVLCINEFCTLIRRTENITPNKVLCIVSGVYLILAFSAFCSNYSLAVVFIPYLLAIVWMLISELYSKSEHPIGNIAINMMSQMYIAIPLATAIVIAFTLTPEGHIEYNATLPFSIFIFLWSHDTGAYIVGSLCGHHKLFPRISPHKTWEGTIGGTFLAIVASQIIALVYPETMNKLLWGGLALVVVVFGTWGDLVESLIKRTLNVKDSGNVLPGHGGWLDRFDSSLLALPASAIYLCIIHINN